MPADDPDRVLANLDHRESGGYERLELDLWLAHPDRGAAEHVRGLVYVAGPGNPNYLGHASLEEIAGQIAAAAGPSGENPEYVFELARSLRELGADDPHVFGLERALEEAIGFAAGRSAK